MPRKLQINLRAWCCHSGAGASALFVAGSKLNHTCIDPTVFYDSGCALDIASGTSAGGMAEFVATRDLAVGTELTISYLLVGRLRSTAARRAALVETKGFWCLCRRCVAEPDWFRGVPCPRCPTGIAAPTPPSTEGPAEEAGVGVVGTEAEAKWNWACGTCRSQLGTLDEAVRTSRWAGRAALTTGAEWEAAEKAAAAVTGRRAWSLGELQERYRTARGGLGPWHWLPNMALLEVSIAYCEVLAKVVADAEGAERAAADDSNLCRAAAGDMFSGFIPESEEEARISGPGLDTSASDDADWDESPAESPERLIAAAGDAAACAAELVTVVRWLRRWVARSPEVPEQVRANKPGSWDCL